MSYSFGFKAATKAEAKTIVREQMASIAVNQPAHKADHDAVIAAAEAFIDLLADDNTKDVGGNVNGWLSWNLPDSGKEEFTGGNVNVNVALQERTE